MIAANNVTYRVGKKALFEDVNIKFLPGECYGIIGANGAGKSTFLKILSGQLETTNGTITMDPGQRLSFLEQDQNKYDDEIVLDCVMQGNARLYEVMKEKDALYAKADFTDADGEKAAELETEFADMDGWNAESDAESLLNGLGIETDLHQKTMGELNGAKKVKVLLARALFGNPDILLLDEPTNHLDMDAIAWLEEFLINFENTVIVVPPTKKHTDPTPDPNPDPNPDPTPDPEPTPDSGSTPTPDSGSESQPDSEPKDSDKEEGQKTPETLDNIMKFVGIFAICGGGLAVALVAIRKAQRR